MSKIKIAMIINDFNLNGISMVVLNYCMHMDLSRFDITILTGVPVASSNYRECRKLGIKVISLPSRKKNSISFYKALFKTLSKNKFDIVHVHGNSAMITIELIIAFLNNIKVRIAHCHNSTCSNMKMHKILLPVFNKVYTHGFACSSLAGKWLFGERKYYVIPNGFEVEKFQFNADMRKKVRKELNVEDKFLIGHIGRFNDQKNHPFLLKVFHRIAKKNPDAVLVLVGGGPDFEKIREIVNNHPYKDRIILYGETEHTEELYNAMDIFVFPSKYEGLGIVLLEAQISGLPCIASDVIPHDVVISDNIEFLPLGNENISLWSNFVLKYCGRVYDRKELFNKNKHLIERYDIVKNAEYLSNLYVEFFKRK